MLFPVVANPPGPYFAGVTTDCNGVASFLIATNDNTWKLKGDPTYTLHVQKVAPTGRRHYTLWPEYFDCFKRSSNYKVL